jgi:ATP-dependent DNA helicase MPH1
MIKKFKDGKINTLIATCVAEEGLDIGNVDLIISYDCLASPIRMIQRFGRTGR